MRIISKHRDYYDGALWFDTDPKCVFIRKMERIENPKDFPIDVSAGFTETLEDHSYYIRRRMVERRIGLEDQGLLFFCGSVIPYVMLSIKKWGVEAKYVYCYNMDDALKIFKKYGKKHDHAYLATEARSMWISRKPSKKFTKQKQMAAFFEDAPESIPKDKVVDHHFTMKSPYFILKRTVERNDREMVVNPVLKDISFYKVYPPPQAAQEIEMFIGGVFGNQAPPMVEVADDVRLAKHGFDKWSFRKEKEDK